MRPFCAVSQRRQQQEDVLVNLIDVAARTVQ
jgi:hypothetical protein